MYKDFDRSIKYTLINRLEELSCNNKEVNELYVLWKVIEKDLTEKLSETNRFFPYFSKHDVSHSKALITNISLFLGENRLRKLSPTDTFLLIFCSYVHDYGMAYDIDEICDVLEDKDGKFKKYIDKRKESSAEALILYNYYHENKNKNYDEVKITLRDLYLSITILLEDFLRPLHSDGVERAVKDFNILLRGRIKFRFINAIITICKLHSKDFDKIFSELEYCCTGIYSDDCHPRFIASMIRIGDLLDLDNGRFSKEFERTFFKEKNSIPKISKIHYLKHESITHLYISENYIEVEAKIYSQHAGENTRDVANEISNWLNNLENECYNINAKWGEIAQHDFGTPPRLIKKKIYIDDTEFSKHFHDLKMELPNDRIFSLLIGSNIYKDKYVAFREVIQNAIDATLLQLWKDIVSGELLDNNKSNYETLLSYLSSNDTSLRKQIKKETSRNSFINRYKIQVNIITDKEDKSVFVEVIDNGTGIGEEDLVYMSKIGGNHMSNPDVNKLINDMPAWFTPSGAFGIGLQSLFQLTNQIDFYTKKNNKTPRHIIFYSYSANKGSIECIKCPEGKERNKFFDKISSHGTMVRFKIDEKLFYQDNQLLNYDEEFDGNDNLYAHIGIEIIKVFKNYLVNMDWNYFPVYLRNTPDLIGRGDIQCVYPNYILYSTIKASDCILYNFFKKSNHIAGVNVYYYNSEQQLFFHFHIPAVQILNSDESKYLIKITFLDNFFKLHYKYSYVDDCQNLFQIYDMRDYPYGEMIKDGRNIMNLTVGIFDNDASKYLSIDRNTLKFNGISYESIKKNEVKCFSLFCEKLVKENSDKINENCFAILALLFTRFVDDKLVSSFINKYSPDKKCKIQIGNKQVSIEDLRNNITIRTSSPVENDLLGGAFTEEIYNYFPRNFFCPFKIIYKQKRKNINNSSTVISTTEYFCKIRRESESKCLVKMDEESKKHEIVKSLMSTGSSRLSRIRKYDIDLLIKSLFKPWSNYRNIVVYKHPMSYSNKGHFHNLIEKNIYNYILSPFDKFTTNLIHSFIGLRKNDFLNKIRSSISEIQQLDKCINYVSKYGIVKNNSNTIRDEYESFIMEVVGYIWDEFSTYESGKLSKEALSADEK